MAKVGYKWTSGILAVTLTAGLFAGCSSKQAEQGGEAAPQPSASKDPVTLEWLAYNSYGQPDPNAKVVKAVSEKFNTQFKFWFVDSQKWNDMLNVKLAAGEMPDVMVIRQPIPKYVENGVLAPIPEDMLQKFAPNYYKYVNDNYKEVWNAVKYDGKLYGLPMINLDGTYPTSIIWRKDWLKNVGITKTPETLQEYEDALTKFRDNDPDQDGKKDTYGLSDYALPAVLGAFGTPGIKDFKKAIKGGVVLDYVMKDGNISFAAIQPEMKDALALLQNWYKKGLIDPEFVTSENTTGYWADSQAFYNNKIGLTGKGMFYHWRGELDPNNPSDKGGGQYQNFKKSQPNGQIAFGKPPVGPKGKSGTDQWGAFNGSTGVTTQAAKDPRKIEAYLTILEANFSDWDTHQLVSLGIAGEDYKEENGQFVSLHPEATPAEKNENGLSVFNFTENPEFLKKAKPFWYQFGDTVKTTGYSPLIAPDVDSLSKYGSSLTKLVVDTYLKIIVGEANVDSFDEFVKKFKANGGDEIEKDVNAAYKKMLGTK